MPRVVALHLCRPGAETPGCRSIHRLRPSRSRASGARSATWSRSTTSPSRCRRGTVTVLLGPNGAGKTTVVRLVTGALHPDAGAVRTLGLDPNLADEGTEARRRCGVVPARPALYDRLTRQRQPPLRGGALRSRPAARRDRRIGEAAARFGIADALGQRVGGYSTGMRARLALARAVLHDPDLLAARRADRRPRPRVGPDGARPHRRDGRGGQDGADVHAPAARGGRARRPGDRDGPRPRDRRRLPRRAQPPLLARGPGDPRRRRPERARGRARPSLRDRLRTQRDRHRRPRPGDATCPTSSTRSCAPAPASSAWSRARRASRSSTSRSGSRNGESHSTAVPGVGDRAHRPPAVRAGARLLDAARDRRAALLRDHPDVPAADHLDDQAT